MWCTRFGLAPFDDLPLQQRVGAGQFGGAFEHPHFQFVARAAHRFGRLAAHGDVVDQPYRAAGVLGQVERAARQARPEQAAVLAHQLVLGHADAAGVEIARGLAPRQVPAALVGIQLLHRHAVHLARRVAEQLFHLAVAAQVEAILDHRDAQHRAVEDRLVFQQRVAQRFLGTFVLGAVFDDEDGAGGRLVRVDHVGDQLRPHHRAVLARHLHFGVEGFADRQQRERHFADARIDLVAGVQRAPRQSEAFVALVAEHLGEAAVVAGDRAVLGKQDADRGVRHDRLHLDHRLARVGDVFEDPDGPLGAALGVDRLGAHAAPEQRAVAPAELHLGAFERLAAAKQRGSLLAETQVHLGRREYLHRRTAGHLLAGVAEHLGEARITRHHQPVPAEQDAHRGVIENRLLLEQRLAQLVLVAHETADVGEDDDAARAAGVKRQRLGAQMHGDFVRAAGQHRVPRLRLADAALQQRRARRGAARGEERRQRAPGEAGAEQCLEVGIGRIDDAGVVTGAGRRADQPQGTGDRQGGLLDWYSIHVPAFVQIDQHAVSQGPLWNR
jgi:hypothetical protein